MKTISVVIPSYNHARYIKAAVESVLSQDYQSLELIVVDDGSKDCSLSYLRGVKDPRFKLIEQENAGAHNAINRGLGAAVGDYLTILNSDDIFSSSRFSKAVEAIELHSADLVTSWIEIIDADGKVLGVKQGWHNMLPWDVPDLSRSYSSKDDFNLNLLVSNFVSTTSNMFFTRSLYESVGGMRNLRFAHDWDFMFRCAEHHKCILISEPLMQYRIHGANTISTNRAWMLFEICWVLATGLNRFERDKLFHQSDNEALIDSVHKLFNSVNLQGNDKLFWVIQQFISGMASKGIQEPELLLLDNLALRDAFLEYVIIDQPSASVDPEFMREIGLRDVMRYLKHRIKKSLNIK